MNRALLKSERMDWETPDKLFEWANEIFGPFTLDAAADKSNAKCKRFLSEGDNALVQVWTGRVWCNPPYGREQRNFVMKGINELLKKHCDSVTFLLPARPDTIMWHDDCVLAERIVFLQGRLKFKGAKDPAPFPSALVHFTASSVRFDGNPQITFSDAYRH